MARCRLNAPGVAFGVIPAVDCIMDACGSGRARMRMGRGRRDALGEGTDKCSGMMVILKGRLSSFGFSGTIAHGMFSERQGRALATVAAGLQSSVRGLSVSVNSGTDQGGESAAVQKLVAFSVPRRGRSWRLWRVRVVMKDVIIVRCRDCYRGEGAKRVRVDGADCCRGAGGGTCDSARARAWQTGPS